MKRVDILELNSVKSFRVKRNLNLSYCRFVKLKLKVFDEFYRYIVHYNNVYKLDIFVYLYGNDFQPINNKIFLIDFKSLFSSNLCKVKGINYKLIKKLNNYYVDTTRSDIEYFDEIYKFFIDFCYYINNFTDFTIEMIDTNLYIIKKK